MPTGIKEAGIKRTISTTWWIVLLLGLIAVKGALARLPMPDFWWHMKIGEVILATGEIPSTGIFSATRATAPFVYQSWGSEVLFALLERLGGLGLILATNSILVVLTYGLTALQAWRRTANGRGAALGLLLALMVGFDNWTVRPQMFSLPLFAGLLLVLTEVGRSRWPRWALLAAPVITALWVNLHGAFILGPLLVGAAALGASLDRRRQHPEAPSSHTTIALWLAALASGLSLLLNPQGMAVIGYVWKLLTDAGSQELGSEWASPFRTLREPTSQLFLIIAFIGMVLLWGWRRTLRSADGLIFVALFGLACTGVRYLIWFGIASGPIIAEIFVRQGRLSFLKPTHEQRPWVAVAAMIVVAAALWLQPLGILPHPNGPVQNSPIARADLVSGDTPLEAVEFLAANPPQGALFHDESYGSYLIWRLGEQAPVFVDTRVELYPLEQWHHYLCVYNGYDWRTLMAQYGHTTALLRRGEHDALITAIQADPQWREIYSDPKVIIVERNPNAPPPTPEPLTCPLLTQTNETRTHHGKIDQLAFEP